MGNALSDRPSRPPNEFELATMRHLGKRRRCSDPREHLVILRRLWRTLVVSIGGPPRAPSDLLSEWWPRIGFQTDDPRRDVRGGGALAIEQLLHFATAYPSAARKMSAAYAANEPDALPLAIVGINLSSSLCKILAIDDSAASQADLHARCWRLCRTEEAFAELFCFSLVLLRRLYRRHDSGGEGASAASALPPGATAKPPPNGKTGETGSSRDDDVTRGSRLLRFGAVLAELECQLSELLERGPTSADELYAWANLKQPKRADAAAGTPRAANQQCAGDAAETARLSRALREGAVLGADVSGGAAELGGVPPVGPLLGTHRQPPLSAGASALLARGSGAPSSGRATAGSGGSASHRESFIRGPPGAPHPTPRQASAAAGEAAAGHAATEPTRVAPEIAATPRGREALEVRDSVADSSMQRRKYVWLVLALSRSISPSFHMPVLLEGRGGSVCVVARNSPSINASSSLWWTLGGSGGQAATALLRQIEPEPLAPPPAATVDAAGAAAGSSDASVAAAFVAAISRAHARVRAPPLPPPQMTPATLIKAARALDETAIERLLSEGVDPLARDYCGRSVLHHIVLASSSSAVMSDAAAAASSTRRGAVAAAVRCVNAVLDVGLDSLDARDDDGDTALHVATRRGDVSMVRLLLSNAAEPLARNATGETPLDIAQLAHSSSAAECAELLSEYAGAGAALAASAGGTGAPQQQCDDHHGGDGGLRPPPPPPQPQALSSSRSSPASEGGYTLHAAAATTAPAEAASGFHVASAPPILPTPPRQAPRVAVQSPGPPPGPPPRSASSRSSGIIGGAGHFGGDDYGGVDRSGSDGVDRDGNRGGGGDPMTSSDEEDGDDDDDIDALPHSHADVNTMIGAATIDFVAPRYMSALPHPLPHTQSHHHVDAEPSPIAARAAAAPKPMSAVTAPLSPPAPTLASVSLPDADGDSDTGVEDSDVGRGPVPVRARVSPA